MSDWTKCTECLPDSLVPVLAFIPEEDLIIRCFYSDGINIRKGDYGALEKGWHEPNESYGIEFSPYS